MKAMQKDRTLYAISEVGIEIRLQMISTEKRSTYHKALEKSQKNRREIPAAKLTHGDAGTVWLNY